MTCSTARALERYHRSPCCGLPLCVPRTHVKDWIVVSTGAAIVRCGELPACRCDHGYSGRHCKTADPCQVPTPVTCGSCSGGKCFCEQRYNGTLCEIPSKPCCFSPLFDTCVSSVCVCGCFFCDCGNDGCGACCLDWCDANRAGWDAECDRTC